MDFSGINLPFCIRQNINAGNGGVCLNSGVFTQIVSVTDCPPNIVAINSEGYLDRDVTRLLVIVLRYHHQVSFGETFCLITRDTIGFGEFSKPYKGFLS